MAKHKAPTQITIASVQEETVLHRLVERYWKLGIIAAAIIAVAILVPTYSRRKTHDAAVSSWEALRGQASLGGGAFLNVQGGSAETLAVFADQQKASPAAPWAKALEVGERVKDEKLDEAEKAASQLGQLWPEHLLNKGKLYPSAGGPVTLGEAIRSGKSRLSDWEKEHANLFSNPAPAPEAPRVRLTTNQGPIVVALFPDRAPKHVENFLKLCREGSYNGTKFHRIARGSMIQGGDPNSIAGEPESWGQGGQANAIENEPENGLRLFKGALAAWKAPGDTMSHGSQFLITTGDQNQMDGQYSVFGVVTEGQSAIEAIESGANVEGRPQDPAIVQSTEVL
jgi:cyclophilin family peptidyl-prolyl cis-trans isomerase